MTYWGGNQIVTLADMPRDVDYSYTKANVIDGRFSYSSSTTKMAPFAEHCMPLMVHSHLTGPTTRL
ncbi:hypothetical protein [Kosakonia sacchari]|uniref:hypothetical protein n=1 Tax=Kosakonia sacchari TaxID=1158459 RepID=UPI001362AB96|nr:hypothetical protein FGE25_13875 [Kosakonia sacchari]